MRNLAVILTVIFSLLLILVVWVAIILQSEKDISLNEIFMQKEISMKDLSPVVDRQIIKQDSSPNTNEIKGTQDKVKNEFPEGEYFIIIGSFKDQLVAKKKADHLHSTSGIETFLLPATKEGYYRISAGRYPTHQIAKIKLDSIRSSFKADAWIYSAHN